MAAADSARWMTASNVPSESHSPIPDTSSASSQPSGDTPKAEAFPLFQLRAALARAERRSEMLSPAWVRTGLARISRSDSVIAAFAMLSSSARVLE
jgi:hypothetical protein